MSAVLVTGGEGYIGRATCEALTRTGFAPVSIDIKGEPAFRATAWDYAALAEIVRAVEPIGAIHLAAHSDAAESVRDPEKYRENVAMTAAVARACERIPVVMASSAAVYGQGEGLTETDRLAPVNPYGVSKVDSEVLLPEAMRLRYFNVAGGSDPNGHIIPRALQAAQSGRPLAINGDGSAVRDFVHVRDVAAANTLALKALLDGVRGEALNICVGQGDTIEDVIARCKAVTGRPVNRSFGEKRRGDPDTLVGDPKRAREVLGWSPAYSLDEMIASAWSALHGSR